MFIYSCYVEKENRICKKVLRLRTNSRQLTTSNDAKNARYIAIQQLMQRTPPEIMHEGLCGDGGGKGE